MTKFHFDELAWRRGALFGALGVPVKAVPDGFQHISFWWGYFDGLADFSAFVAVVKGIREELKLPDAARPL